ncbi:MAG: hypothetical protein J0I17_11890 ['Candidatus Kapabacteria' thiocyanatum]|uniref:Mannosyl-glycoprotein endo-beta-N-acetylglucosamidase-like domain-containing protein n=1 Tax=Candidatus Kapaibacterium thiocyanatum TaxID=1895771 RepID=A0A1M3L399_9BACT|nr:hypothetical protein ['Candidatus Kapabacteria' thiocyanatum]OJX59700.1 MAG: hypothetical protein BGO89_05645 ['Candidatus Kapabacteria' thiocyanatum]
MNTGRLHAILVCILLALPPTIRAHYHRTTPVVRPQDVDLKRIFREITTTPAADLFTAAGQVYRDGKLEDAAFLFYVAQLRVAHDMLMYPARGTGGNSPLVAFGAIASVLGPEINGALSSQPTIQHAALQRVRKWAPATHRTYSPGWEYTERRRGAFVTDQFAIRGYSPAPRFRWCNQLKRVREHWRRYAGKYLLSSQWDCNHWNNIWARRNPQRQ